MPAGPGAGLVPAGSAVPLLALPGRGLEGFAEVRAGVLVSVVTPELVAEVVAAAGCREKRRRLLPAVTLIYLVLGMCLLSGDQAAGPPGYRAVMRSLSNGLRCLAGAVLPTRQALGQGRARVGDKPLELLFDRVRGPCAEPGTPGAFAFGRRVAAMDACTLAVPLSAANLAAFGAATSGSLPSIRLLALIECGTHALIEAAFDGAARASEQALARRVLHAFGAGLLVLADRNFPGYELWAAAAAGGADLIWRVRRNVVLTPLEVLPDGSYRAVLPTPEQARNGCKNRRLGLVPDGIRVRVIDYTVTVTSQDGTVAAEEFRLITTLPDPAEAPAREIAALYHERWESEDSNGELKTRLKGAGFTLRSRTPALACQEMWAFLTVYHALCSLEARAAVTAGIDPGRISFSITVRAVRDQAKSNDIITRPGVLDRALRHITSDLLGDLLPARRGRCCERKTNPRQRKYATRDPAEPRPPAKVSYTLTISTARTAAGTRTAATPGTRNARPPP
jgi:hypothetical protein